MSNPGFWGLYEHLPPAKHSSAAAEQQPSAVQQQQPPQAAPKKAAGWQPPFSGGLIPPVKRPKVAPPHKSAAAKRVSAVAAPNHEAVLKSITPPPDMMDVGMTDSVVAIEVSDPYDPAHPNSFEEYLEEKKMREFELATRERELEDLRAMEREEERLRERDRARNRRMGAAIPPPMIYHQDDDVVAPSQYAPPSRNSGASGGSIAEKMMRNMGWKGEGHGLGKNQQGIAAPIALSRTGAGQGVIVAPAPGPIQQDGSKPSKTVLLRNMVGRGQVDPDLGPETQAECGRFGRVLRVFVDESTDLTIDDEEAVRIFVQFDSIPAAKAAIADLNGRYFAGRKVRASFYDEERFQSQRYRDSITNA